MNEKKKASPWMWVGCGCGLVILLIGLAVGGAGFFAVKKAKEFGEAMTDPEARRERVVEILGGDELPPGFHAMFGFSIPFIMDIALLSDRPPGDDGEPQEFGDAGVIYFQFRSGLGSDQDELRAFFEGETNDIGVLRDNNINIDVDEILDRGSIDRSDLKLHWIAQRGDVDAMGNASGDSIAAMMLFDCPQDEKLRMAIWFESEDTAWDTSVGDSAAAAEGSLSTAESEDGSVDYTGTPADPAEIERFANYFRPCPA